MAGVGIGAGQGAGVGIGADAELMESSNGITAEFTPEIP